MKPQEQYPKFYTHPEIYLGVEVECIEDYTFYNFFNGNIHIVNLELLSYVSLHKLWQHFKPLFKPQQGEQFIKDLEDAVSCGIKDKSEFWEDTRISKVSGTPVWYELRLKTNDFWVEVKVTVINLSEVIVSGMLLNSADTLGAYCFDTAAYVDRMRELGYYI